MKTNEVSEFETTKKGYRLRAMLEGIFLTVEVQQQEARFDREANGYSLSWWIRSRVVVALPATKAEAQRLVHQHVDSYDPDLKATLEPAWELWDQIPVREFEAAPTPTPPVTMN